MEILKSLGGEKLGKRISLSTQSAMYTQLLSGRTFRGEYNQDVAYTAGDVVVYIDPINGSTLYEAVTDVPAGTTFDAGYWTAPAIGSPFCNAGTVVLSNSLEYPLNNSSKIITLKREMDSNDYIVLTSYSDTAIDDVEVYNKAENAFNIRYWGTATLAKITWAVLRPN